MPTRRIPFVRVPVLAERGAEQPTFWWRWEVPLTNPVVILHCVAIAADLVRPDQQSGAASSEVDELHRCTADLLDHAIRQTRRRAQTGPNALLWQDEAKETRRWSLYVTDLANTLVVTDTRWSQLLPRDRRLVNDSHARSLVAWCIATMWIADAIDGIGTEVVDRAQRIYQPPAATGIPFAQAWLDRCACTFAFEDFDAIATDLDAIK